MPTYRRTALGISVALLVGAAVSDCVAAGGSCLRFSDCEDGLTCVSGKCVLPDGGDGGGSSEGGEAGPQEGSSGAPEAAPPTGGGSEASSE